VSRRRAAVLLAVVAVTAALAAGGIAAVAEQKTGSPERGKALYDGQGGCANCHTASADGSQPSIGPELTLANLRADAAQRGKPLGDYVAESILVPNAFAAPGYVSGTMPAPRGLTTRQVEDLVSYLIGGPWTSPTGGLRLPADPVAACNASRACRSTAARLVRVERLPASAVAGAKVVAVSGCLSCHRYAGSGRTSAGAPDLTRAGRSGKTIAARVRHLKCPRCVVRGSAMPSYAGYSDANLRRIAEFLRVSRGTGG
jgi:mono/diheme cytochrome c family protein